MKDVITLAFDRAAVDIARNCLFRNEAKYGDEYTKSLDEYGKLMTRFSNISMVMDQIEAKGCLTLTDLLAEMAMDVALNEHAINRVRPGTDPYTALFRKKIDLMNAFTSTLAVRDMILGNGEF